MATLFAPELSRRRSRPLIWTAVLPPTILGIVAAVVISLNVSDNPTIEGAPLSGALEAVGSAAAGFIGAGLVPAPEGVAFGSSEGCDRPGMGGDLAGQPASAHEVFRASLDSCLGWAEVEVSRWSDS